MKQLLKWTLLAAMALTTLACSKEKAAEEPVLDVTANNISGIWTLAEWSGGELAEGTYVYVEFVRRDQLFTLYDNLGSFSARRRTGRFNITIDDKLGAAVIRGMYDYGTGDWQHHYIITGLTATQMTWTAVDDPEDISVYRRCDAIPADILAELPADKE